MGLNHHQCNTLCAIFKKPTASDIKLHELLALLPHLNLVFKKTKSGLLVNIRGNIWGTHRPHPLPFLSKPAVDDLRKYLNQAGLTPAQFECVCKS
jgi:hypothetical protein